MNKKEQYVFREFTSQGFSREDAFKKMKTQIAKEGQSDNNKRNLCITCGDDTGDNEKFCSYDCAANGGK